MELIVPRNDHPMMWGSYPMIPWCGRLARGELGLRGDQYDLPLDAPPHAIHGTAYLQTWEQVDASTIRTSLGNPWPFGGNAVQRFDLGQSSLTVSIEIQAGDQAMPVMAGWHPWFLRQLERGSEAILRVDPGSMYALDPDQIPTGKLVSTPPPPWDDCFVDLTSDPVIEWPGALTLTISSTFDHWVIYTEPDHALCVEPQSGPPNQFQSDPFIIEPGESFTGSMTLAWA